MQPALRAVYERSGSRLDASRGRRTPDARARRGFSFSQRPERQRNEEPPPAASFIASRNRTVSPSRPSSSRFACSCRNAFDRPVACRTGRVPASTWPAPGPMPRRMTWRATACRARRQERSQKQSVPWCRSPGRAQRPANPMARCESGPVSPPRGVFDPKLSFLMRLALWQAHGLTYPSTSGRIASAEMSHGTLFELEAVAQPRRSV